MWLLSESGTFREGGSRTRPRGLIHYGTIDGPEGARLLPGVVGDEEGEVSEDATNARRDVDSEEAGEQVPRGGSNGVPVQNGVSTQDNPWH